MTLSEKIVLLFVHRPNLEKRKLVELPHTSTRWNPTSLTMVVPPQAASFLYVLMILLLVLLQVLSIGKCCFSSVLLFGSYLVDLTINPTACDLPSFSPTCLGVACDGSSTQTIPLSEE